MRQRTRDQPVTLEVDGTNGEDRGKGVRNRCFGSLPLERAVRCREYQFLTFLRIDAETSVASLAVVTRHHDDR
jgi:hypothetical protein